MTNLAEVSVRQRDNERAIGLLQEALHLHRGCGNQFGEVAALLLLGETLHSTEQPDAARRQHALALYADVGAPKADHAQDRLNASPAASPG